MGVVHKSEGHLEPCSPDLKSETSIICELGSSLEATKDIPWDKFKNDYSVIRDYIEKAIPGFASYNDRVQRDGGFYLPNPPRDNQEFKTPTSKANFSSAKLSGKNPDNGKFSMMTIRSHDQYNTTIYGLDDRYRGIFKGRMVVLINKDDMNKIGIKRLDRVRITNTEGGKTRSVAGFRVVPYDIPENCIATYFPEANPLVPISSRAIGSNTPTSKYVEVTIEPE